MIRPAQDAHRSGRIRGRPNGICRPGKAHPDLRRRPRLCARTSPIDSRRRGLAGKGRCYNFRAHP